MDLQELYYLRESRKNDVLFKYLNDHLKHHLCPYSYKSKQDMVIPSSYEMLMKYVVHTKIGPD